MKSNRWLIKMACLCISAAAASMMAGSTAIAQEAAITQLVIQRQPGASDGNAMATVREPVKDKGSPVFRVKRGRIAKHVIAAWIIMEGQGALLLLPPANGGRHYRLRYYQLDSGKGRMLGDLPFAKASLVESKAESGLWAFALSGIEPATGRPVIFVGDTGAIHTRLDGASAPRFTAGELQFRAPGEDREIKISTLVGEDAAGHIYEPAEKESHTAYIQFLPNGTSIGITKDGAVNHGHWLLENDGFHVDEGKGTPAIWPLSDLKQIAGVPADARLTVRLLQPLSTRSARKGTAVKAVLISPGVFAGALLLPQGSEFDGQVTAADDVGWGITHERSYLTVHFDSVKLPDGRTLPVDARVFQVENARESVTETGKIQGVRSTGTLGYQTESRITSLAQIDPVAYLFAGSSGPAVLGFAEPEILYNAGTELNIEFNAPLITAQSYPPRIPQMKLSGSQAVQFNALVRALPFRTRTEIEHKPSDITNLIFLGQPEALLRAFKAAGWTGADALTAAATYKTIKTVAGNQAYSEAPMSTLILGDHKPLFTLQKTTNTFSSRHHLRVFNTGETFDGEPVLTASSTQDIGIAFSYKQRTFIHEIDPYLDNERSKITNDLQFTGCVDSIALFPRPWVPRNAYNSTGDRLITDGDAVVLRLNACSAPYRTPDTAAPRAPLLERSERNTMLGLKDTLYRGNLVYTGISSGIKAFHFLASQGELGDEIGEWQKNDASGVAYRIAGAPHPLLHRRDWLAPEPPEPSQPDAEARARAETQKWDPPHFELALNLGYSAYRNSDLELTLVGLVSSNPANPEYFIGLFDEVGDGWAAGISLTLNTWNWVSNEFSYMRQQNKFNLSSIVLSSNPDQEPDVDSEAVGLVTRRYAYNTVFNLRPRKSRWRPYIDAGPAFQLLSLSGAPLKKPNGYFRLGLSNVGLIKAAFEFGNVPPLNGGGIFQFGLQYGGGFKYRVTPRLTMRADFGETWSPNPDIIGSSYDDYNPDGLDDTYTSEVVNLKSPARYIQQRATIGLAFTF